MGTLMYNDRTEVSMDDRTLAHLQVVMIAKLRRQECFAFSWKEGAASGDGRSTIWVHPMASLRFKFSGSRAPALNPAWVQVLSELANSGTGLHLVPEPPEPTPAAASGSSPRTSAARAHS